MKKSIRSTKSTTPAQQPPLVTEPQQERSPIIRVDFEKRKANRELPTERVLELLKRWLPRAYEVAEVVGKWVWVAFPEQQPPQITSELSQLGFHWNSRRKVWQHPCGVFRGEPTDPRSKYQSFHPADQVAA